MMGVVLGIELLSVKSGIREVGGWVSGWVDARKRTGVVRPGDEDEGGLGAEGRGLRLEQGGQRLEVPCRTEQMWRA
jgi:hypothetical protein